MTRRLFPLVAALAICLACASPPEPAASDPGEGVASPPPAAEALSAEDFESGDTGSLTTDAGETGADEEVADPAAEGTDGEEPADAPGD